MKTLLYPSLFYFALSLVTDVLLSVPALAAFEEAIPSDMDASEDDGRDDRPFSLFRVEGEPVSGNR